MGMVAINTARAVLSMCDLYQKMASITKCIENVCSAVLKLRKKRWCQMELVYIQTKEVLIRKETLILSQW